MGLQRCHPQERRFDSADKGAACLSADYRADVTGIFRGGQRAYFDSACLIYFRGFNKGELHISYEVANEVPIYQHDFECPINLYKIIYSSMAILLPFYNRRL